MKTVIVENYIQGLASFLDEENFKWEQLNGDSIRVYYDNESELFLLGFRFGKFYHLIS